MFASFVLMSRIALISQAVSCYNELNLVKIVFSMPPSKKIFIETHGCQMNEYDSDKMADVLGDSHGYVETKDPQEADVILMNTCSIREKAQDKVFSQLGRYRKLKIKNPDLVIGVGGCVASQEGEAIRERAPLCGYGVWPSNLASLAGNGQFGKAEKDPCSRHIFPRDRKIRQYAGAQCGRPIRICIHHGGVQ